MILIDETIIRKLIYHHIDAGGSKLDFNESLYDYQNEEEEEVLKKIFLKPFLSNITTYEFKHEINLELNPLFKLTQSIYENDNFVVNSRDICKHLKAVSKHPQIKSGDLFILKFDDLKMNDKYYEGLGIYKIENKENYIETSSYSEDEPGLKFRKGIGNKRLDKACLILFTEKPYTILIIDNTNTETDYWQNEFIKLNLKNDNINNTNQFLTLTKTFITNQLPQDFATTKTDQIDLLNRSVEYFQTHESFNKEEFNQQILQNEGLIEAFQNFDSTYRQEHKIEIADDFVIFPEVVKKQSRIFKSVLKLDKNFHIYIHGRRDLIEQGFDKDGRKFYKIYFESES